MTNAYVSFLIKPIKKESLGPSSSRSFKMDLSDDIVWCWENSGTKNAFYWGLGRLAREIPEVYEDVSWFDSLVLLGEVVKDALSDEVGELSPATIRRMRQAWVALHEELDSKSVIPKGFYDEVSPYRVYYVLEGLRNVARSRVRLDETTLEAIRHDLPADSVVEALSYTIGGAEQVRAVTEFIEMVRLINQKTDSSYAWQDVLEGIVAQMKNQDSLLVKMLFNRLTRDARA